MQVNPAAGPEWAGRVASLHEYWAAQLFTRDCGEAPAGCPAAALRGDAVWCTAVLCRPPPPPLASHTCLPGHGRPSPAAADITPVMFCASLVPGVWQRGYEGKLEALHRSLAGSEE